MDSKDRTFFAAAQPIIVRIERGKVRKRQQQFLYNFKIGRGEQCDIQFDEPQVSTTHAEVVWEDEQWWIHDLGSKNGTYINGKRIDRAPLISQTRIEFALSGPRITFEVERGQKAMPSITPAKDDVPGATHIVEHYFGDKESDQMGDRTRMIRAAYQREVKKHSKKYWMTVGIVSLFLAVALAGILVQQQRVEKLQQLHDTAVEMYYAMKSLEMDIANVQSTTARGQLAKQFAEKWKMYERIAREELSRESMSAEDWLIYKVARRFGECDVNMPNGFKEKVKQYISYWQSTPRFRKALERAQRYRYPTRISKIFLENDMQPEFFYLALQESDFDTLKCGPQTRKYGYAKGMWQFIRMTGERYGLQPGPLADLGRADAFDDRHKFEKSTRAAAQYIRDLYLTEAQGSGLLVMACYNWGEERVLPLVRSMPQNPRERNFWTLLANTTVPQQTYDYVFYIVSAAVIGENPRLFGFDFDNPLELYQE